MKQTVEKERSPPDSDLIPVVPHLTTCFCSPWFSSCTSIVFFIRVISMSMLLALRVACCRSGLISVALATYSCASEQSDTTKIYCTFNASASSES
ncbi:hypothetical protein EYF80_011484 [Liparis tanakae]|uniref:Uncharacterized protein n=1 Tax=Liparis tanakae TaxID=230148 RepID=A0A4Z2ILA1_9TELE|nr:hypothetical protein EYF80_011484 [Liparis tanakae]